jgi:hypothetical protein
MLEGPDQRTIDAMADELEAAIRADLEVVPAGRS